MIGRRRRGRTPARQQPIGRGGTRRRRYMPTTMARQQPIGTQRRRRRTPAMQQPLSNRAASLSAALNRRRGKGVEGGTRKIKKPVSTTRGRTIPAAQRAVFQNAFKKAKRPSRQQPMLRQPSFGTGIGQMGFFNEGGKMSADDKKLMAAYKKGSDKT